MSQKPKGGSQARQAALARSPMREAIQAVAAPAIETAPETVEVVPAPIESAPIESAVAESAAIDPAGVAAVETIHVEPASADPVMSPIAIEPIDSAPLVVSLRCECCAALSHSIGRCSVVICRQ